MFYPRVHLAKYEAWNITDSFEARARVFFLNKNRGTGKPLEAYSRSMMETYKEDILKTPPKHFVNVWLNATDLVDYIKREFHLPI